MYTDDVVRRHVLLVPSRADLYGVTLVEGLAHGLPVVASDTGGDRTMVVNDLMEFDDRYNSKSYQTGWLLGPAAPAGAYAAAVAAIFSDEARYSEIAANCHRHYASDFAWSVASRTLRAALERARRDDLTRRFADCAVSE